MKKFFLVLIFSGLATGIFSQEGLTPAVKAVQEDLIQHYVDTGYGDYEIDLLHKKIALLIPKLKNFIETDSNGEKFLKITITEGQSERPTGERYLINGYSHIYPGENQNLKKVELNYIRQNASGNKFQREKRTLVNPTPEFLGENQVDSNMDIKITLFLTEKNETDFKLIREVTIQGIDRHDRKKKLLDSYKQYLRKTLNALERRIRFIELNDATQFLFMLEFE
jgi:hypothetical protein